MTESTDKITTGRYIAEIEQAVSNLSDKLASAKKAVESLEDYLENIKIHLYQSEKKLNGNII